MVPSKRAIPPASGSITALPSKRGSGERLVVFLDGVRAFDVSAEVATGADLRVGSFLTEEAAEALQAKDAPFRAKDRAVAFVAVRDRSCAEVESRLLRVGFDAEVAAQTVEWLKGLGYLDDEKFAAKYAAERSKSGWGGRRIAVELGRLGVDRSVVREAIADIEEGRESGADGPPGLEAALRLARRRFGREFAADPQSAARRLSGFLARRGFDWDTIHAVARTLESEAESGETQALS